MAGFAVTLATLTTSFPSHVAAKKISNTQAASLLSQCYLEKDSTDAVENVASEGWVGCCSKTLGYCVECPTSGRGKCIKIQLRKISIDKVQTMPSGILNAPTNQTPVPRPKLKRGKFKFKGGTIFRQ